MTERPRQPRFKAPGPVVTRFMKSAGRRRVILGPFGSGKSVACCNEIVRRARRQAPSPDKVRRTRWAVVRNTYRDLINTTVKTWRDWFGDEEFGPFIQSAPFVHRMRMAQGDGTTVDCEVIFLAMDNEADAKKFLSLELTGIYFNELRELQRGVVEAGDGRLGRYPSMKDGGPSWYGMIADSNMPDEDHWLYALAEEEGAQGENNGWEFYRQPGGVMKAEDRWIQNPSAENIRNLTPGYYTGQLAGKSDAWISVHLAAEYGRLPVEGSYFADELAAVERAGRICEVSASPDLPVHTFWDIGVSDYMSIWCGQSVGDEWNFIHFYENTGHAIDHYVAYLREQAARERWTFGDHVWPHDGFHRDAGILGGLTRADVLAKLGLRYPVAMPRRKSPGDWIDGARRFLRQCRFNAAACRVGLTHLRKYAKRRDAARNVYLNEPLHDEHSHAADAFQVAAMGRGRVSNASAVWKDDVMNFRYIGLP